ncbi:hypothetical protein [Ancylobacter terrae]|uniref:hypothetical protein n=1 Tax=Ancylobacter sp. sgz301288 TaxID=3342077 RepID=UPI00385DBBF1
MSTPTIGTPTIGTRVTGSQTVTARGHRLTGVDAFAVCRARPLAAGARLAGRDFSEGMVAAGPAEQRVGRLVGKAVHALGARRQTHHSAIGKAA